MPGLARFEGKVAIVTGAASGIGRAVLRRFVAEGGLVTGVDLNEAGLEESVALANAEAGAGGRASYLVGSVAEEADVGWLEERAIREDVEISNGGAIVAQVFRVVAIDSP